MSIEGYSMAYAPMIASGVEALLGIQDTRRVIEGDFLEPTRLEFTHRVYGDNVSRLYVVESYDQFGKKLLAKSNPQSANTGLEVYTRLFYGAFIGNDRVDDDGFVTFLIRRELSGVQWIIELVRTQKFKEFIGENLSDYNSDTDRGEELLGAVGIHIYRGLSKAIYEQTYKVPQLEEVDSIGLKGEGLNAR